MAEIELRSGRGQVQLVVRDGDFIMANTFHFRLDNNEIERLAKALGATIVHVHKEEEE